MEIFDERKILLQLPIAALVTVVIAFVFNNAFFYVGEGLQMAELEVLFTPISLFVAAILTAFAFDFHTNTVNMEEVPVALIVLGIVSLIGVIFEPMRLSELHTTTGSFSSLGGYLSTVLLLSYTFIGISVSERYIIGQ